LVNTLDEFEALGVKFIATRDQVDLTTPAGRMFVQILGSLAEFERALIRERILLGLDHARAVGKTLGRPRGEDRVAEICKLKRAGLSHRQVVRKLGVSMGAVVRAISS
jgi:DNA invertase Pin-like site-specific DNA recombinase